MFADDTTIYFNLEDFPALNREQEIKQELEKLNVDKTKCMFFHKRRAVPSINLSMNNIPIDIVPHFNYLGIILDKHLSWTTHVAMVTGKPSKINGILNRLKRIYSTYVLLTIINHYLFRTLTMGHLYVVKILILSVNYRRKLFAVSHQATILHIQNHF